MRTYVKNCFKENHYGIQGAKQQIVIEPHMTCGPYVMHASYTGTTYSVVQCIIYMHTDF
jgi:hypothetical protein